MFCVGHRKIKEEADRLAANYYAEKERKRQEVIHLSFGSNYVEGTFGI